MKKKWLCMYLMVVMLATTLSPAGALAEDFTDVDSNTNDVYESVESTDEQDANTEDFYDVTENSNVKAEKNSAIDIMDEDFTDNSEVQDVEEDELNTDVSMELGDGGEDSDDWDDGDDDSETTSSIYYTSEPLKKKYIYGSVRSAEDFDLTGFTVGIRKGNDEEDEIFSFTRSGEEKLDQSGKKVICTVLVDDDDFNEQNGNLNPGDYYVRIEYEGNSSEFNLFEVISTDDVQNQMQLIENGIYTGEVLGRTYVKIIPKVDGEFVLHVKCKEETIDLFDLMETDCTGVYDSGFTPLSAADNRVYKLQQGKVYYVNCEFDDEYSYIFYLSPAGTENEGVCGLNVTWKMENGIMTISGTGEMFDYSGIWDKKWKNAKQVIIENGVTSVGKYAFEDCDKLTKVSIPESVSEIGDYAFSCTNSLSEIDVNNANMFYSSLDGILYNKEQTDLLWIPSMKTECHISSKINSIGGKNIGSDFSESNIFFSHIGLDQHSRLKAFSVDKKNPIFTAVDGVLYTRDKKILLVCPNLKETLNVAKETRTIYSSAAEGCTQLESVSFPTKLKNIEAYAFYGCRNLEEIVIPESVEFIGNYAFQDVNALFKVYENSVGESYVEENDFEYEIIETDTDPDTDPDSEISYMEFVSYPKKRKYAYGKIKSAEDFDLTGLEVNIEYEDGHEESLSFTKSNEQKMDAAGNLFTCQINVEDSDYNSEDENVNPGEYQVTVEYDEDSISGNMLDILSVADQDLYCTDTGVYTGEAGGETFVRMIPEICGMFELHGIVVREDEDSDNRKSLNIPTIYDSEFAELTAVKENVYVLEQGKTYYLLSNFSGENCKYIFYVSPVSQDNSGICGANVTWKLEDGTMTISGTGEMYDYFYDEEKNWSGAEQVIIQEGVTSIGDEAFRDCENIKFLTIPKSVKVIGERAFGNCKSLKKLFIPANVSSIGEDAFFGTRDLAEIEVDTDNEVYCSLDGILYNKEQTDLIWIPSLKTECCIPSTVTSLGGTDIRFYSSNSYGSCRGSILASEYAVLEKFTVDEENPVLISVDGVLYTKDKKVLLACPALIENLNAAEETESIQMDAAADCKKLSSVILPDGLKVIGRSAFVHCTNLKEITIPEQVQDIYGYAFKDTNARFRVYAGTEGERYVKACGFTYEIIENHTHIWDGGTIEKKATCKEYGILVYKCTLCEAQRQETIPLTDHTWQEWKVEKAPGCLEEGKKERICSECEKVETEIIPAFGNHLFGDYKVMIQPTVLEKGEETRECSRCHLQETREIPKLAASIKLIGKTLPLQVKKSVSANALIASMDEGDRIASVISGNSKVAAVNNKTFKITAKKAGKSVIAITTKGGAKASIVINVKKGKIATTKITGIQKKLTLKKGKKLALKPVLKPITSTEKITFTSSDKKIATVTAKGVIKAVKKGKAKITVKSGKRKVICTVTVTK